MIAEGCFRCQTKAILNPLRTYARIADGPSCFGSFELPEHLPYVASTQAVDTEVNGKGTHRKCEAATVEICQKNEQERYLKVL